MQRSFLVVFFPLTLSAAQSGCLIPTNQVQREWSGDKIAAEFSEVAAYIRALKDETEAARQVGMSGLLNEIIYRQETAASLEDPTLPSFNPAEALSNLLARQRLAARVAYAMGKKELLAKMIASWHGFVENGELGNWWNIALPLPYEVKLHQYHSNAGPSTANFPALLDEAYREEAGWVDEALQAKLGLFEEIDE